MTAAGGSGRKQTGRTLAGLRESLFETLDRLRDGQIDPKEAATVALLAKGILDSAALQLQFEKAWSAKQIADKLRAVELVPSLTDQGGRRD